MKSNKSSYSLKNKNLNEIDNVINNPTIADLMREQNVSTNSENTVHRRRDLDCLG